MSITHDKEFKLALAVCPLSSSARSPSRFAGGCWTSRTTCG